MRFDYCIGNPPYQSETESESTRMPPVYHIFMDQAYQVADAVELITPARFLFNAGYTPKNWNEKMLSDPHFKVQTYEPDSSVVFSNTDIKGGVAISYRDKRKNFGPIGTFTKYPELNSILRKVQVKEFKSLETIIASPLSYKLSEKMIKENPNTVEVARVLVLDGVNLSVDIIALEQVLMGVEAGDTSALHDDYAAGMHHAVHALCYNNLG